ncbi:metallophosphoesterase [Tamlana sp. 2201CG12-4]|uniref:metallophosphoesterase n=1 Tax=Tamlana sp. 2201CG12-4 TaxID=3112582 RepID=UPI002DBE6F99|nr:metallophosphoesterase [Tamlana sp. 2201CG12-4]MEC3908900.1 metallophosphoesterase [Tamlana sp. 2201CG12-4]
MTRLVIIIFVFFLLDLYAYQSIKTLIDTSLAKGLFFGVSLIVTTLCFYTYLIDREVFPTAIANIIVGAFIILSITKLVLITFLLLEDVIRIFEYVLSPKKITHIPSRRKFISQIALGAAAIPFASLLYGVFKGKYNYRVIKHSLYFDGLPEAFDGYKITHVSDFHCGSFDNKEKVEYGIDLINQQASDLIAFTGDLVNLKTSELQPWKATFSKLKAKDGVFSILGNHDYGDYAQWESKNDKQDNFTQMLVLQKEMGFDLLLNEKKYVQRNNQQIAIIGVENWGKGFVKKGDLSKAIGANVKDKFSVVLSHDPTHWEKEIIQHSHPLQLTLSGHTHGMQMGIEIPGFIKWSPIKYRYKRWAGIYKENGKYININRGFGFLAFPGRIGIWPEITVIELKKKT